MFRKFSHRTGRNAAFQGSFLGNFLANYLAPIDLLSTIFFSILFSLLFTLAYSILIYGGVIDLSFASGYGLQLFTAILGTITAWGIIDGIMYALTSVFQRGEKHRLLHQIKNANSQETALELIADELDFILEPITHCELRQVLYADIAEQLRKGEPKAVGLQRADVSGALALALVSVLAVLPSLMPFLLLPDHMFLAIRLSNLVSFSLLFIVGYRWGLHVNVNPWWTGLLLAAIALIMVLVAMALGG